MFNKESDYLVEPLNKDMSDSPPLGGFESRLVGSF